MNTKTTTIIVLVMSLVILGCGQGQLLEWTMTPVQVSEPTMKPEPTKTPVTTASPTVTPHTPDPEAVKLVEEAFSFSKQGEDEKAIEAYTKAIETDPLYGQPYINRGSIYADHRELEKALADFNKGLELDPTNPLGYSNRAQVYIELDKLDEALKDIKSLLNLTEDDQYIISALTLGGHIYDIQDKLFLALAAYTAALEMNELFTPALISRGQIYLRQEDRLRAFKDLTLALEITEDPELRDAITNILMGVYPEGTTMDDAIMASESHYYKAMEYQKAGDYKNASESLSKAIEIDPLNNEYYYQRGWNYTNFDDIDIEKAETDMSYVIALNPFSPAGYYSRGIFEAYQGLAAESIADVEKAFELDLESGARAEANQLLKDMRQLYKSCQFTAFESVNDAKKPKFLFTFKGPPNTDFIISAFNSVPGGEGSVILAITPQDGITPTGIEYELKEDETTPIELDIKIRAGDCQLRKTAVWPSVDILALLSGLNPIPTFTPVAEIIQGTSPIALAGISNIYMANDAEGKNITTTFVPTDVIYVFFDINQVESGAQFQIKWFALNVNGQDPTEPFLVTDYTYAGEPTIYAQIESTEGGFPVAQYKVEIYLDGAIVGKHQFIVQ